MRSGAVVSAVVSALGVPGGRGDRRRVLPGHPHDAIEELEETVKLVLPTRPLTPEQARTPVSQLKGHTIGVNTLNNIATLTMSALLKPVGLAPQDVKFIERPFPEMAGALDSGQVEVAFLPEPFSQTAAGQSGAVALAEPFAGPLADFPIAGYLTTETFAAQNPKVVAAFQRALRKAAELALSNPAEVAPALEKYTKIDRATAATMKLGGFATAVDPAKVQRVADLMLEFGYLKQKFDVTSLIAPAPGS